MRGAATEDRVRPPDSIPCPASAAVGAVAGHLPGYTHPSLSGGLPAPAEAAGSVRRQDAASARGRGAGGEGGLAGEGEVVTGRAARFKRSRPSVWAQGGGEGEAPAGSDGSGRGRWLRERSLNALSGGWSGCRGQNGVDQLPLVLGEVRIL